MLEDKLKKLGLSDNEIKVYLCVLENTKVTPAMVARKTGVSRPTAYGVGKSLAEKGFIELDDLSPTLYFLALPPENIGKVVRKEKLELDEKIKTAEELVKDLSLVPKSKNYSVPKVKFVDENHMEQFLLDGIPRYSRSAQSYDKTWWGVQDHTFLEKYPDVFKIFFKESPKDIVSKIITNIDGVPVLQKVIYDDYIRRRNTKFWKAAEKIAVTQEVAGDYVLIINTRARPHYMIEIHDSVMAENQRQLFRGLWETLP
jgi:sugar-specific transcriptional regulator TrmB